MVIRMRQNDNFHKIKVSMGELRMSKGESWHYFAVTALILAPLHPGEV